MPTVADLTTTALAAALVAAIVIAALLGWFCYRLLVDRGHLLLRFPEGGPDAALASRQERALPAGSYLSDFALPALSESEVISGSGITVTLSGLSGSPFLLVFLRADCLFSRAFARELAGQQPGPEAPLTVTIIVGEPGGENRLESFSGLPGLVLLDAHGQVAPLLRVAATPCGYLVADNRHTIGPVLAGPIALLAAARGDIVASSDETPFAVLPLPVGSPATRSPLTAGEAAPDFTLPIARGGEWSLAAHHGEPLTLIFTDPSCPPCAALFRDLGPRARQNVVIVSRGDAEENRQLAAATGITAPLLLQKQREVARAYRALETPAAFQIDERGKIAAGPVIGKEAVLGLLAPSGSVTARGAG